MITTILLIVFYTWSGKLDTESMAQYLGIGVRWYIEGGKTYCIASAAYIGASTAAYERVSAAYIGASAAFMSESENKANLSQAKLGNIIWVSYNHFLKGGGAVKTIFHPKLALC